MRCSHWLYTARRFRIRTAIYLEIEKPRKTFPGVKADNALLIPAVGGFQRHTGLDGLRIQRWIVGFQVAGGQVEAGELGDGGEGGWLQGDLLAAVGAVNEVPDGEEGEGLPGSWVFLSRSLTVCVSDIQR